MVELHGVFAVMYALAAVVSLAVAVIAWRRRAARGARSLAALMLGIALWSGASAPMWYAPTLSEQALWLKVTFLGVWMVPVAVMALALDMAGVERWRTAIIAVLGSVSFAFVGVAWLNPGHLYDAAFVAQTVGPYTRYATVPGPLYLAYNVFAFATIIAGLLIILRLCLRSTGAQRTRAAIVFTGGMVPVVFSAVSEVGLVPIRGLDLAPLAFLATGAFWLVAILRGTLLELVPVARGALVEQMSDGVLVLDPEGMVVDANPAALAILHRPLAEVLRGPAAVILDGVKGASEILDGSGSRRAVLPCGSDGDPREIEFRVTPFVVGPDAAPAQLVTLRDVTELRRAREGLELARTVFDTTNEGIVVAQSDADRRIVDVNDSFCRLIGRSKEDLIGRDLDCLRSDRQSREFYEAMETALVATGQWRGELWLARADGTVFPAWASVSLARDGAREHVKNVVAVFTDITEIREAERISKSEGLYRALTELTPDFVFVVDSDMHVVLANSAAACFLGRPLEQVKGARIAELFGPLGAQFEGNVSKVAATGRPLEEESLVTGSGPEVWLKSFLVPLTDIAPGLVLAVSRDITDSKRLELTLREHADEAQYLATHDALTGIENRRAFVAALDRAIALVRRHGSSTVFFVDVDRFKQCNDERGHAFGDEVLISVAGLLKREVREVDLIARIGGDEFAVVLAGSTAGEAAAVAERMRGSVEALGGDLGIPISLSIGIVSVEADASADDIIAAADEKMYEDKAARDTGGGAADTTRTLRS